MAEKAEIKIQLSDNETELLRKALEEAAQQASVPAAGDTTQYLRRKTEAEAKTNEVGSPTPPDLM